MNKPNVSIFAKSGHAHGANIQRSIV